MRAVYAQGIATYTVTIAGTVGWMPPALTTQAPSGKWRTGVDGNLPHQHEGRIGEETLVLGAAPSALGIALLMTALFAATRDFDTSCG